MRERSGSRPRRRRVPGRTRSRGRARARCQRHRHGHAVPADPGELGARAHQGAVLEDAGHRDGRDDRHRRLPPAGRADPHRPALGALRAPGQAVRVDRTRVVVPGADRHAARAHGARGPRHEEGRPHDLVRGRHGGQRPHADARLDGRGQRRRRHPSHRAGRRSHRRAADGRAAAPVHRAGGRGHPVRSRPAPHGGRVSEVTYTVDGPIARIALNRPEYRNAQNVKMTLALDAAYMRAMADDEVKVVVLSGNGKHFSAGHDIGTPGRDIHEEFERTATTWYPHADKPGAEAMYVREQEAYLGMCRRWRDLPKPTIAMVHGACIAGALMLAWSCDLIVASDDAFFADPVVRMGIPGVEFFAHPYVMNPRKAKEFLFLGDRMTAQEALAVGMLNRVVPRAELETQTMEMARRIAEKPRFGLALTKKAINQAEDRMGMRDTMDAVYGLHHLAHAHNALTKDDHIGGQDAKSMKKAMQKPPPKDSK
ncbi:MAG: enoyl-CoA hydratase [Proteobacteria bacterium]|nr:enoyl-CoA hydratase [Pseudomonadota bacterium]